MNRKLRDIVILVAVGLALVWCIPAMGQVLKGSISGTATDPQGAVVSGATVKATETATGAVHQTTSDSSGLFRFNLIPSGEYKLEISAPGFKTAVQNNIIVSAGRDSGLGSVKLTVGEATTTVEVVADAPLIETSQSQVTNTFSGTQLTTFAGVQENEGLDNLALFVPGVTASRDVGFSNTNGGSGFSVNGLRGRNNDQQIDGQNNNDNSVGGPSLFVSDTEFVQQYVLVTNQFGPEYGRNAGSVVNIITKSGTNNWHGSVYGAENNSVMNALTNQQKRFLISDAAGTPLSGPPRLNDEFGGVTIGGPLAKNKAFIFGGFDQELISTIANFHSDFLTPTPAGLATLNGCFPGSTALQAFSKIGPFAINAGSPIATTVPLNPNVAGGARGFPLLVVSNAASAAGNPGTPIDCDNVQFGGVSRFLSAPTHNFNFVGKTDFQLGSDTISARYLFNRGNNFNLDFGDAAAGFPISVPALSQAMLVSWTKNISSHMVNEARVSFNRLNVDFGGNTIGTVPTGDRLDQAVTRVSFRFPSGFFVPGSAFPSTSDFPSLPFLPMGPGSGFPQFRIVNTWQAQDNWNLVWGKHTLKAGVNYTYQRSPNGFLPTVNGSYQFDGWGDFGFGSNFVDNAPNRVQVAQGPSSLDFREHDTFLYGGDDWKISQSLTLNLGLTWSYYGQPANLFNQITTARESNPATAFWRTDLPLSVRTFPTFPAPKNSFGPSVGFAYSPQWGGFLTGHGKTVLRGGYRLLYDPPFYNIYLNMAGAAPQVFLQSFTGGSRAPTTPDATTLPLPTTPLGPNVRASLQPQLTLKAFDPRSTAETTLSPNFGPDKVNAWVFGIERELTKNSAIEARYSGNRAYDLFQSVNANPFIRDLKNDFPSLVPASLVPCAVGQVVPNPAAGQTTAQKALGAGRVNCAQGVVRSRTNTGYSYYNGAQVEFRANNLFKQLTIRTGYTFSKTLDNVSEIFSSFGGGNSVAFSQNPLDNSRGEYSFSGLDVPHQWTALFTEELPFFKEQHGVLGHLLGGWAMSGNYILASGQRYTPSQIFAASVLPFRSGHDYYDSQFFTAFNGGVELARPFVGNLNAPSTAVGITLGDACGLFGVGLGGGCKDSTGAPVTSTSNNRFQLVSVNAINTTSGLDLAAGKFKVVNVSGNDVRFIVNARFSETMFGTPFGNTSRNLVQDAITNVGNFSIFKKIKMTERTAFEFRGTMVNVFNHFNFSSVDPFVEDAGLVSSFTGFGDVTTTGGVGRRIIVGGKISF